MTGPQLRTARQRLGWTQQQAAATLGVSARTLSRWECGAVRVHATAARFVVHLLQQHAPRRGRR